MTTIVPQKKQLQFGSRSKKNYESLFVQKKIKSLKKVIEKPERTLKKRLRINNKDGWVAREIAIDKLNSSIKQIRLQGQNNIRSRKPKVLHKKKILKVRKKPKQLFVKEQHNSTLNMLTFHFQPAPRTRAKKLEPRILLNNTRFNPARKVNVIPFSAPPRSRRNGEISFRVSPLKIHNRMPQVVEPYYRSKRLGVPNQNEHEFGWKSSKRRPHREPICGVQDDEMERTITPTSSIYDDDFSDEEDASTFFDDQSEADSLYENVQDKFEEYPMRYPMYLKSNVRFEKTEIKRNGRKNMKTPTMEIPNARIHTGETPIPAPVNRSPPTPDYLRNETSMNFNGSSGKVDEYFVGKNGMKRRNSVLSIDSIEEEEMNIPEVFDDDDDAELDGDYLQKPVRVRKVSSSALLMEEMEKHDMKILSTTPNLDFARVDSNETDFTTPVDEFDFQKKEEIDEMTEALSGPIPKKMKTDDACTYTYFRRKGYTGFALNKFKKNMKRKSKSGDSFMVGQRKRNFRKYSENKEPMIKKLLTKDRNGSGFMSGSKCVFRKGKFSQNDEQPSYNIYSYHDKVNDLTVYDFKILNEKSKNRFLYKKVKGIKKKEKLHRL